MNEIPDRGTQRNFLYRVFFSYYNLLDVPSKGGHSNLEIILFLLTRATLKREYTPLVIYHETTIHEVVALVTKDGQVMLGNIKDGQVMLAYNVIKTTA